MIASGRRPELGEPADRGPGARRDAVAPNMSSATDAAADDVVGRHRRTVADLAANRSPHEQGAGGLLEEHPGFPAVRDMRSVDVAHPMRAEIEDLAVGERHRWAVAEVVRTTPSHPSAPCATSALGAAARNTFIAPHSSASRWPNVIQRRPSTGVTVAIASRDEREHPPRPGVEQQRLLVVDQELVEREPGGAYVGRRMSKAGRCDRRSRRLGFPW